MLTSLVNDASATETGDARTEQLIEEIRSGKWRTSIERIRQVYSEVMERTGSDRKAAREAVAADKKKLPGVLWSGQFTNRERPAAEKLTTHSGLLCADLDGLGQRLPDVREKILTSPHLWALFLSPTADGLKAVFRVAPEAEKHLASFHAVKKHVLQLTGEQVDESCKDLARLCFVSFDPDAHQNPAAIELTPLIVEVAKPNTARAPSPAEIGIRQRISVDLLGQIEWTSETSGFCVCPGRHLHETGNGDRDCELYLDKVPTIYCFHGHCKGIEADVNRELRSRIGKAESAKGREQSADDREDLEPDDEEKPTPKSAATRLVQFAEEFAFFHDPQSRAFVCLDLNGHSEIWPVNSLQFRNLLAKEFYHRTRKAINRNALADAVTTLQGRALFDCPEKPVFLRVAPHDEGILVDLCDPQWRVVEITCDGWRILEKSPVGFIRTGSMRSLPEPTPGGSINPLWDILNVTPGQRPLVAGALLNYFHPAGPFFVTNLVGEQGTAKSCAARILRMLIDPNETPLRSPPRTEQDLLVQAASNRCVALDNLSTLPPWLSDSLCRLATGGGHSARSLYTDAEEFTLSVKRPVILNGIEDVAARPDLAERALQIELETIPEDRRMTEKELWRKFEAARPQIFSAILDAIVCALRELPKVKLDSLPRMADAALWATAGETAFGLEGGTFMDAYSMKW
ncbi:MAG: hypothetical protein H0U23_03155 [Blastocatellia bacterium]|nr:hypothetical protein [Blastocatellia bacterium]